MNRKVKSIDFVPNLIPLILNKTKTLTYRYGDKYIHLNVGDRVYIQDIDLGENVAVAEITKKSIVKFKDLPVRAAGHERYLSKEHQRQVFKKYYGRQISNEDDMLVLGFKLIKKI